MTLAAIPPPPLPFEPPPRTLLTQRVPIRDREAAKGRSGKKAGNDMRTAWKQGRADAALWTEFKTAKAQHETKMLQVQFRNVTAALEAKTPLTSSWAEVTAKFGRGEADLLLQFELAPRKDDDLASANWHVVARVKEMSRTSFGGEDDIHWAARIVLACRDFVMVVPDHRSIYPAVCEAHSGQPLAIDSPLLSCISETGSISWDVAVTVRDAGGPPDGTRTDWGGCC